MTLKTRNLFYDTSVFTQQSSILQADPFFFPPIRHSAKSAVLLQQTVGGTDNRIEFPNHVTQQEAKPVTLYASD